jgi:hypothetical protein
MSSRAKWWPVGLLAGVVLAAFAINQALAGRNSELQTYSGVSGTSVTRVKMYSGAGQVIKSTAFTAFFPAVKISTADNKNEVIRIRLSADTHCRAMNSAGVGYPCRIRFVVDGDPMFPFSFGRSDFLGSQSMESYRVFFDEPGIHTVVIQAAAPNQNVWFYLSPWTATVERVNNGAKL